MLADTHAPRRWRSCPPEVAAQLRGADLILHAGDVCTAATLDELAGYAPVRAVRGNNDGPDVAAWGAPDTLQLDLAGLSVAMLHDSGPAAGRPARMRRRFPGRAWSSSGTRTSRWTTPRTASGSSTRAHRPTGAASPAARSAPCRSSAAACCRAGIIPVTPAPQPAG